MPKVRVKCTHFLDAHVQPRITDGTCSRLLQASALQRAPSSILSPRIRDTHWPREDGCPCSEWMDVQGPWASPWQIIIDDNYAFVSILLCLSDCVNCQIFQCIMYANVQCWIELIFINHSPECKIRWICVYWGLFLMWTLLSSSQLLFLWKAYCNIGLYSCIDDHGR